MGRLVDGISSRKVGPMGAAAGVLAFGLAAGLCSELVVLHPEVGLTTILLVVSSAPMWIRVLQRRFDPFEPIQILGLTLLILYAVRPAAELLSGMTSFRNEYMRGGFIGAELISLVGILSLYIGYAISSGLKLARRAPSVRQMWDPARSVRFGVWVLVVCALFTAAFAGSIGASTMIHFFLGRSQNSFQSFLAVSGYVGLGPYLTIPAAIIFLLAYIRLRSFWVFLLFVISLAGAIFVSFPAGNRTYVLALVFPLLVVPYLRKGRRPSGLATVVAVIVAILAMNVLLATRRTTTRAPLLPTVEQAVVHMPRQLKDFATGVDLAEFSVLELEHEALYAPTNPLHYQPGQTLLSLLAYPLPRHLIGTKPQAAGQAVVNRLFPTDSGMRASFNPALFGDFFADDGWLTLVVYCLVVGVALRFLWEYFVLHASSEGMQLVFAETLPLIVIMVRNSAVDAIARSLFLSGPLLLCLIVCSRPRLRRFAGWRVRPELAQERPAAGTGLIAEASSMRSTPPQRLSR